VPEPRRSYSGSDARDSNGARSAGASPVFSEERTALDPGEAPLSAPADGPKLLGGADFPEPRKRGAVKVGGRPPRRCRPGSKTGQPPHGTPWGGLARFCCLRWPPQRTSRKRRPPEVAGNSSRACPADAAPPGARQRAATGPVLSPSVAPSAGSRQCNRRCADAGGRLLSLHVPNTRRCEVRDATTRR
jgi:hypothetical protein